MYARIVLHLAYQSPVGLAGVHLAARPSMYCECLNATVLKLFGQLRDNYIVAVPAQTGLYRYWNLHRLNHLACNFEHQWDVAEHTGTGSLAGNLLHRTTEIQVNHVRTGLLNNLRSLYHRV